MNKVQENLTTALNLLEAHGFGTGILYGEGKYCMVGAVFAGRSGLRGMDVTRGPAYDDCPELEAIVRAIEAAGDYPDFRTYRSPGLDDRAMGEFVCKFNDRWAWELDEQKLAIMRKAIEIAGEAS